MKFTHPLFMGRQVFGELPALFFLIAGYVCFLWAGERSRIFLLWFNFVLVSGDQYQSASTAFLGGVAKHTAFPRDSRASMGTCNTVWSRVVWFSSIGLRMGVAYISVSDPKSAVGVRAVSNDWSGARPVQTFITILTTLQLGLPTLLGLLWAICNSKINRYFETHLTAVRFAYLILAGSWFVWWELASLGWPRYLFPAAFLASIFVSAMFHEWTQGFRISELLWNTATNLIHRQTSWCDLRMVATLFLVVWSFVHTVSELNDGLFRKTNTLLFQTVEYLNTGTPSTAVIETYESELFFLLHRRYHYPPDQVHVELIRREDLNESRVINYDPLSADPDYLVVGGWCRYYKC